MRIVDNTDQQLADHYAEAMASGLSNDVFAKSKHGRRAMWRWLVKKALTTRPTWRTDEEAQEVRAKWRASRMECNTAPGLGAPRRQGRL